MREYKFRAWDHEAEAMLTNVSFRRNDRGVFIESDEFRGNCSPDRIHLMQYTGLRDSNNTEIFEGDIIEWYENEYERKVGTVHWSNAQCGFVVSYENGLNWFLTAPPRPIKVIGNIYKKTIAEQHSLASA